MKKVFPFILLVWPYLFMPAAFLDSQSSEGGMLWLLIYCILTPIIYIANIICATRTQDAKSLACWNMALKLCHIPSYLFVFLIGLASAVAMIKLPFTALIIPILVIIDVLLLCTTSAYGVCALVRSKQEGQISTAFMVVNIILHILFVWDVVSSIIVCCKIRKTKSAV